MDNELSVKFMQLKKKKDDIEKSIMEANVRIESLQSQLKDAMKTLEEVYGVTTLEEAQALLNQKDLEYSAIANQLDAKLKEYEDLLK